MCELCGQSTHDKDRDCPRGRLLKWSKLDFLQKLNQWAPVGRACFWCISTHRRYFEEDLGEFVDLKAKNNALEGEFFELRRGKTRGDTSNLKTPRKSAKLCGFVGLSRS